MVKSHWLIIPLLICFVVLPRISTDLYLPTLPHVGITLHATNELLQMTLTAFMFGYAFSMLIAGNLADMIGRKAVMKYGLIMYVIATVVCAMTNNMIALIIARFFQALGGCCGTVVARVMVKDAYSKEDQIKILAYLSTAMAISPLITPILGGALQLYFGWRAVFYVLGFFGLFLFIFSNQQLQETNTHLKWISLRELFRIYKQLLKNKIFIGYSLTIGLAWCDYFAFTLESPFILQKTLGLNPVIFGVMVALVTLGYVIGTYLTKKWANHIGWDNLILKACIISLIGSVLLFGLVFSMPLRWEILIFPMIIIMVGVGIIIPCTQGAVMQPFPNIAGIVSGLFFFIQMAFGGICGLILQSFEKNALSVMCLMILISSIVLVFVFYKLVWCHQQQETT